MSGESKKEERRVRPIWQEVPFIVGTCITLVILFSFAYSLFCLPVISGIGPGLTKWQYLKTAAPNEIGDTLAGVAGSLAFVWLVVTVWLQAKELREQRTEFEEMNSNMLLQRFDSSFFEFLSTHSSIVASIDLTNSKTGTITSGRDCFEVFYRRLTKRYRDKEQKGHTKEQCLEMAYKGFWTEHQLELGHYFRFLFNFLRFLDENKSADTYHSKLVRSQLSDQELLLIFYNCTSPQGEPFIEYAEKFELFDNLPTVRVLSPEHIKLVPKKCFGGNPMHTQKDMKHSINQPREESPQ